MLDEGAEGGSQQGAPSAQLSPRVARRLSHPARAEGGPRAVNRPGRWQPVDTCQPRSPRPGVSGLWVVGGAAE